MNLAQNIDNIAKSKGLTLTEIERLCGFPKSSIRKWSENIPNINKVISVCQILNISIDYLVYGRTSIDKSLPSDEQELLNAYRSVDEICKAQIRERAITLSDQSKNKT